MGVERRTPGYMIREESKRDKLRTRMRKRAISYEEKLEREERSVWARKCWEEIKRREGLQRGGKNREKSTTWREGYRQSG